MEDRNEQDEPTQTTAAGLTRLATSIVDLLGEQAIDSRFGTKLLKRLDKEADRVATHGPAELTKPQKQALRTALEKLEKALHTADANTLVLANAKLRSSDATTSKKGKAKA